MTDQNNAAQAAEQAIKAAIRKAYDDGYNDAKMAPDNCSTYCVERAVRLDSAALLSKLRAPVAGEAQEDLAPPKCPITGRPFFMALEHPELGWVPTYGGPYDSYTIPHLDGKADQPWHERELRVYRYDHDLGGWRTDEVEVIPLRIVHEDVLNERHDAAPHVSEAVRSERDATGRTPTDYALEFAEYLARDVEYAMACLNSSQRANEALLDLTEEVATADAYQAAEDAAAQADEAFTEAITALQSAVFEFRKRRDRAAPSAQPGAQNPHPKQHNDGSAAHG